MHVTERKTSVQKLEQNTASQNLVSSTCLGLAVKETQLILFDPKFWATVVHNISP